MQPYRTAMTELPVCGAAAPDARRGATLAVLTVGVGLVVLLMLLPFSGVLPAAAGLTLYAVVGVWAVSYTHLTLPTN